MFLTRPQQIRVPTGSFRPTADLRTGPGGQRNGNLPARAIARRRSDLILLASALAVLALLPGPVFAQRVYWEPNHGTLGLGKTSQLNLVFEDCAPAGEVTLPPLTNLETGQPSVEQRISTTFGHTSTLVVMHYPVRPTGRGEVVIPAFDVVTNRGRIAVGEVRFGVGDATVGQGSVRISDIVSSTLRPARTTVWAGEVVDLEYTLLISPRFNPELASNPEWKPSGVLFEPFGRFESVQERVGNETRIGARYRTRMIATEAGAQTLDPVRQTINLQTGERSGFIFAQPRIESFTIASNQPAITVRELPPPPPGFTGAVGTFELESKVVPETARVGEPITWTMTLRGIGNWPANPSLPPREVSADFQVVQPQGRHAMDDGRLFSGSLTEDAVLVPTRPGTYTIGPVRFVWFDTGAGTYREESVPPVTVTILPPPSSTAPAPPAEETAPGVEPTPEDDDELRPLPNDLPRPGELPRDPLPAGDEGVAPRTIAWWWWLPGAFTAPALLWLALAWSTMAKSDRYRTRRDARRQLVRLLTALARSGVPPDRDALAQWRRLTTQLWLIDRATPTIDDLALAVEQRRGAPRPDAWLALWRDAEAALFAAARSVPPEWAAQALDAARSIRLRREQPPFPLRLRHWMPSINVVIAASALALGITNLRAAEDPGTRAYREGKFAAARAAWGFEAARRPHDWAVRNNLALACAQEDDWAAAAAHWTAAFLLNPREPSIRANLRLALTHLDGVDPELRRLVEGSWLDRAVTMLSPGEWQMLYFAGALTVGLALCLFISTLYGSRDRRWRLRTGWALLPLGILASAAGFSGKALYGPLGEPAAGLVAHATQLHSIPTDLAERQQTAPLPAGAVVVPRRSFLSWQRVDAGHPDAGWVRRDVIIPFYDAPPTPPAPEAAL